MAEDDNTGRLTARVEKPGLLKNAPASTKGKPNIQAAYLQRGMAYSPNKSAYDAK